MKKIRINRLKLLSILIGAVSLTMIGCNDKPKPEVIVQNTAIKPAIHPFPVNELLNVDKMDVFESKLVCINRQTDSIFYVYDTKDGSFLGAFGRQGHGPDDFLFPFFLKKQNKSNNEISTFDVNGAAFKNIRIDKVLNHEDNQMSYSRMYSSLIGSPNLIMRKDSCFLGNMDMGQGLFFLYNLQKDSIQWIPYPEELQCYESGFTIMNINRIAMKSDANSIISAMKFYNLLFLYDGKGNLKKSVRIGENEIEPIVINEESINGESKWCFSDIIGSEDCVYVLEQSIKEKDFENLSNPPSRIIVLDWELDYRKTYQLPHYVLNFCYDKQSNRIFYSAYNEEGGTDLYYFDIE